VTAPGRNHAPEIRAFDVEMEAVCAADDANCEQVAEIVNGDVRVPGAGSVSAGAIGTLTAEVIPDFVALELTASGLLRQGGQPVKLLVRAVGGRNSDEELESGIFEYYVTLCEGCLLRGFEPPAPCPGGSGEGYCGRAQDGVTLDCCVSGGVPYCPASSAPTTP
jgi:hypothetical protein